MSKTLRRLGFAALAAGCLLVWLKRSPRPRPTHEEPQAETDEAGPARTERRAAPVRASSSSSARRATSSTFGRPNPVIESVTVDKTEVCRGEENFVHVSVATVDGTDADLRIWLAGPHFMGGTLTGPRLPIRMFAPMTEEAPAMVMVTGAGGTHAEQPLPFVTVKDCNADPFLRIQVRHADGPKPDLYTFSASTTGQALRDVTWSFGDGSSIPSAEPEAQHDFGGRQQLSAYADFLITATARDENGRTVRGYTTLELVNNDYWKHRTGS
jgi:hypothetical protein